MPPPLTLTTLALSPTGAIALDTPVKAESTNGTFSTLTSLFMATTPCCGVAWLSSNWMTSFFDSILSALACSAARLAAAPNSSPYSAFGPLIGRSAPILMTSCAAAAAIPTCAAIMNANRRMICMRFPLEAVLCVVGSESRRRNEAYRPSLGNEALVCCGSGPAGSDLLGRARHSRQSRPIQVCESSPCRPRPAPAASHRSAARCGEGSAVGFSVRFWQRSAAAGHAGAPSAPAGRAAATIAARLTFEGVERRYPSSTALAGFSLDIAPAEVVCLLGPSGCGKTTLLRIAAGIERPTGGRVLINGSGGRGPGALRAAGAAQRRPDVPGLRAVPAPDASSTTSPSASSRSPGRMRGARRWPRSPASGSSATPSDYPHILSGGEQQRVALARAIVPRPAVMLMDEPFSGLDVQLRERLQEETLALLRETRATCLIVTHAPAEAIRLGDRIAVMRAGRLVQAGKAEDALPQPGRPVRRAAVLRDQRDRRCSVEGGALQDADRHVRRARSRRGRCGRSCASAAAPSAWCRPGRACRAACCTPSFLGDLAVLEIAAQGFERPLQTLVREWEVPRARQRGGDRRRPRERARVSRREAPRR